jgi:hypothetical protein
MENLWIMYGESWLMDIWITYGNIWLIMGYRWDSPWLKPLLSWHILEVNIILMGKSSMNDFH